MAGILQCVYTQLNLHCRPATHVHNRGRTCLLYIVWSLMLMGYARIGSDSYHVDGSGALHYKHLQFPSTTHTHPHT